MQQPSAKLKNKLSRKNGISQLLFNHLLEKLKRNLHKKNIKIFELNPVLKFKKKLEKNMKGREYEGFKL